MNRKSTPFKILQSKDFLKDVKKVLKSGDRSVLSNIQRTIDELKIDPYTKRPNMDIKLISKKNESIYRVRLGKYRLVYEIDAQDHTVFITMFFRRGKGYRKKQ